MVTSSAKAVNRLAWAKQSPCAAGDWSGLIPQENGPDAVYVWETHRLPGESWLAFVQRCASETLAAVKSLPRSGELPSNVPGRILYNLTWVSESDYDNNQPLSQS